MQKLIFIATICCAFFLFFVPCVDAQQVGRASAEDFSEVEGIIVGYLEENHAPGALVAVISEGQLAHTVSYGMANVELKVPVTDSTVFEIGSISKQFVAVAIMMLVEEGRLDLDAPIHPFLPEIPGAWVGVTVRQLLTHTSGIPDYEEIAGYDVYQNRLTSQEVIRIAHTRPIDFEPGTGWHYSNTGYFLLSLILERIEGRPLGAVLYHRIFEPLGMKHTRMADPEAIIVHRAAGYWIDKAGNLINRPAIETSATLGAGGLVSSAHDMAIWDAALYGEKLLTTASKTLMWTPVQLDNGKPTTWPWGDPASYGFGWEISSYRGSALQSHSGQTAGFVAQYMRFPDQQLSIIAFINLYDTGAWPPARVMADYVVPGLAPVSK